MHDMESKKVNSFWIDSFFMRQKRKAEQLNIQNASVQKKIHLKKSISSPPVALYEMANAND